MHVVLVKPEIPQNTGNIGRLCVLTRCQLHLVGPLGFSLSDHHLKRAGLDYWPFLEVTRHDSLAELQEQAPGARFYYFSSKAARLYTEASYRWEDYLVFGCETRGLPRELIRSQPRQSLKIPMWGEKARSLNLSNAVAVVVYEALRQIRGF
ncbi:MAG: tRNA (cytidine(34)-2'-O)-methyltransferase [Acidobacteriota bacterium]|nr:tRNA (cytidine(34)-2'-O)-methyltransferase [Acidobacteriota bacterium]